MPFDVTELDRGAPDLYLARDLASLRIARNSIRSAEMWCKNHYHTLGRHCAFGALEIAEGSNRVVDRLIERLVLNLPHPWYDIVQFNDDPDTTHADIMALYDRTIISLERSLR